MNEFVKVLIEAVGHRAGGELYQPGFHKRPGNNLLEALRTSTPARDWWWASPSRWCWPSPSAMWYWGIGLHKISLGSLIIALGLLGRRRHHCGGDDGAEAQEGYDKVRAATFAYEITAMPMFTGTLITAAGLPIGLGKSTTGEYTFAILP